MPDSTRKAGLLFNNSVKNSSGRRSRLIVAGTGSGCGKTTVTLGLMRALAQRGLQVQGFKCGPDYIDPAYHAAVTGRPACNLDSWMTPHNYLLSSFMRCSQDADVSIIEGVMGLYDGKEPLGLAGSTAEIAILTGSPVLLVVDARSMGRSAAAVVLGFRQLEPEVNIAAVIVNRCGSASHYGMVKAAIEAACGIPVIGWLGRDAALVIPERHLGLLPAIERGELEPLFNRAAGLLAAGTDLERLLEIAAAAPPLAQHVADMPPSAEHATATLPLAQKVIAVPPLVEDTETVLLLAQEVTAISPLAEQAVNTPSLAQVLAVPPSAEYATAALPLVQEVPAVPPSAEYAAPNPKAAVLVRSGHPELSTAAPVIAVARDAAFNFYYGDNLELLAEAGARLVEFSPLRGDGVPEEADGIYLGGGFPEEFAAVIAANAVFMNSLRAAAAKNMPLYAECGGYMVLARTLTDRAGIVHEMAGIIPAHSVMQDKRAALGYREVTALADCLLLRKGESLRGHEFHYSLMRYDEAPRQYAYESSGRGGIVPEGYLSGQIMAAYAHIHLASHQSAAYRWVEACRSFRNTKSLQFQEVQTD